MKAARRMSITTFGVPMLTIAVLTGCSGPYWDKLRGDNCVERGELDQAIEAYTAAISGAEGMRLGWAYNNRGSAYLDKEDYRRAIEDHTKAIDTFLDVGPVGISKGRVRVFMAPKPIGGTAAYARESSEDMDIWTGEKEEYYYASGVAYYNRAFSYYITGNYDKAIEDVSFAIRSDSSYRRLPLSAKHSDSTPITITALRGELLPQEAMRWLLGVAEAAKDVKSANLKPNSEGKAKP